MGKHDNLWTMPNAAKTTMTKKELQEFLLEHHGKIIAGGRLRVIKSQDLGVGIYEVWTEIPDYEIRQINSDVDGMESAIGEIRSTLNGLCDRVQALEENQLKAVR